jgi:2-polyprenyl-3-methyl-5-hydroxy-6-metoxy-1,4-benzoquinol methylase
MTGVLEHLKNPVATLVNAGGMLKPGGYVIAIVPNAQSLNRRIGVVMGIIKDPYELGTADVQIGHRRFYDLQMLTKDFISAGYVIISRGGIFLKPLSNAQMMNWNKSICDSLYIIGKELPQYCGLIYVRGAMKQIHPKRKKSN